ncbi:hypothetical protein ACJX0J_015918, partial [Zea mays]
YKAPSNVHETCFNKDFTAAHIIEVYNMYTSENSLFCCLVWYFANLGRISTILPSTQPIFVALCRGSELTIGEFLML